MSGYTSSVYVKVVCRFCFPEEPPNVTFQGLGVDPMTKSNVRDAGLKPGDYYFSPTNMSE